ncbi:hypothetical protein [Amycolatopsis sp. NPDC059021]|uniref:hypothetical protein n=1 Tax=Amycolatopsis sp. NPDC059021 TaxID=3346704 RepID=UPI003670857E
MRSRTRVAVAVSGCTALILLAAFAVVAARPGKTATAEASQVSIAPGPGLVARSTADESRGRLIGVNGSQRSVSPVGCQRLYAAGGTGICLRQDGDLTTYQVAVLDEHLAVRREIPLAGIPNRARVSPSGRLVAWTVFVTGDSYNGGRFSTRVGILDTRTQELVPTLEDWTVSVEGKPYAAADLNFWGVTFAADDRHFYVTMSTGAHRYLMRGDLGTRRLESVRDNVECPSLSPDGGRVAFKAARDGDPEHGWRLAVLDLATGRVTPLAETRSVDDQAAWVDDRTLAYGLPRGQEHSDVWTVPADGTGSPSVLVPDADSPAVLTSTP